MGLNLFVFLNSAIVMIIAQGSVKGINAIWINVNLPMGIVVAPVSVLVCTDYNKEKVYVRKTIVSAGMNKVLGTLLSYFH